jgi:hypothetical protein
VSNTTKKTKGNTPTVAAQNAANAINKAELDSWAGHVRMVKAMDDAYQSVSVKAQKTHNRKVANLAGKSDSWVAQKNGEGRYINALLALGFTLKAIDGLKLNPSYFWKAKGINPLNAMVKAKAKGQAVELPKALTVDWLVSVKALNAKAEAEQKAAVKARNEAPKGKRNRTHNKNNMGGNQTPEGSEFAEFRRLAAKFANMAGPFEKQNEQERKDLAYSLGRCVAQNKSVPAEV